MAFGRSSDGLLEVLLVFGGEDDDGVLLPDEAENVPGALEAPGELAAGAFGAVVLPASATGSDEWRQ